MNIVLFCQSFTSCWNHGNRHFLRGVARALVARGHRVTVYEPEDGWSTLNALRDGAGVIGECAALVPGVTVRPYQLPLLDVDAAVDGAALVIVHDQNDPDLVRRLGERRRRGGRFRLLFHDTHPRAITAPDEHDRFELDSYDAILVSGERLRQAYVRRGWGRRAVTWHAAADTAVYRPRTAAEPDTDVIWTGSGEDLGRDIDRFLVRPVSLLGLRTRLYDARCPEPLRSRAPDCAISYEGWLLDHRLPVAFGSARAAIDIASPTQRSALAGTPTLGMFEALACGTPLIAAGWRDTENLFHAGSFLTAHGSEEMAGALHLVMADSELATEMAVVGLCTIRARHTCEHRVDELLATLDRLDALHGGRAPDHREMPQIARAS